MLAFFFINAVVFSELELAVCRLSSVTLVHPTQAVVIFRSISTAFGTLATVDIHEKFYGDRPRGTPSSGELNTRGSQI